jgi:hypothetical protein
MAKYEKDDCRNGERLGTTVSAYPKMYLEIPVRRVEEQTPETSAEATFCEKKHQGLSRRV